MSYIVELHNYSSLDALFRILSISFERREVTVELYSFFMKNRINFFILKMKSPYQTWTGPTHGVWLSG
jgi:hypothetical protein